MRRFRLCLLCVTTTANRFNDLSQRVSQPAAAPDLPRCRIARCSRDDAFPASAVASAAFSRHGETRAAACADARGDASGTKRPRGRAGMPRAREQSRAGR